MPFSSARQYLVRTMPLLALLLLISAPAAHGQSTDVRFPSPVKGNEIVGAIVARDIGDARLTDHFYTFNGLAGDLLITIQSENLNGDFDVFTAGELRPVVKITVYTESSTPVTKSIYLRKPESFILRIEARSPNDDKGSYRIRFSGSFELSAGVSAVADDPKSTEERSVAAGRTGNRKTTRVSSSGARIEEPPVEVATAPTPDPTPAKAEEPIPGVPKKTVARTPRGRRTPIRKGPVKPPTETANKSDAGANNESRVKTAKVQPAKSKPATTSSTEGTRAKPETPATDNKRSPTRRSTARSNRTAAPATKPEPSPENTARLLIEVKDGTQLEYLMSTVRRVTVENGQIVIVGIDGHVKRVPMTTVVRMSIGP